eukprot:GFUD01014022.1.p1 GENE.GFUD01014022.1~~GFUD01014022.1.p1  ORF type:complete len:266 (-),score=78.45 GFUD01014022.1:45-842(-)
MTDYFSIENANYSSDLSSSLSLLLSSSSLCDTTLVCEDGQVAAHKVILAATSSFFSSVFKLNQHNHPLIYLRGVHIGQVQSVLQFVYNGATSVAEEDVNSFMTLASDLKIKGLEEKLLEFDERIRENEELAEQIADYEAEDTVFINFDPLYSARSAKGSAIDEDLEIKIEKTVYKVKEEEPNEPPPSQATESILSETNQNTNQRPNTLSVVNDTSVITTKKVTKKRPNTLIRAKSKQSPFTCSACKARIFSRFLLEHHICKRRKN